MLWSYDSTALIQVTIEQGSSAEWATAIATSVLAALTLLVAIVAAFQDRIRSWIWHPKLELHLIPEPPDCHKIPMTWEPSLGDKRRADCYYLRVQVANTGNQAAEMVEMYLDRVLERTSKGFERRQSFLPMNLVWAHFNRPFLDRLSPHLPKHCALAHVLKPSERDRMSDAENNPDFNPDQTILSLDLVVKPNTKGHLLPTGTYRLKLVLGASNATPVTKWVEIDHTGQWFDDEQEMLSRGLQIRLLSDSEVKLIAP
jgi:hypothetical protein